MTKQDAGGRPLGSTRRGAAVGMALRRGLSRLLSRCSVFTGKNVASVPARVSGRRFLDAEQRVCHEENNRKCFLPTMKLKRSHEHHILENFYLLPAAL